MRLADLAIPARPEYVSLARLVISSVANERYQLSDDQLDDLKLAVSEACVIAISESSDASVQVSCEGIEDGLRVLVGSGLGAFNAESLEGDSLLMEASAPAGEATLGLPFISTLVDELSVEPGTDHERLCLTVRADRAEDL